MIKRRAVPKSHPWLMRTKNDIHVIFALGYEV